MKSQKGITLTSLVVYIVVLLIVLGLLSNISKYFYSNTKYITDANKYVSEFNKFNMYFIEDVKNNIFYEEISNEENGIARDICKVLRENDIIVDKEVVEVLKNHNNYVVMQDESIKNDLQEIVKIANRTLKIAQINKAKEEERKRNLQSMNKSLENVGKVIENCAQEIVQKKENEFNQKEQQIELLLHRIL